ncbi:MAG: transporter, family, multidrug resistance protein [Acetobacteraceae bacterium]|nr:transporter, family, multidrug resistance protein [Acetobacteraceae bacterium]
MTLDLAPVSATGRALQDVADRHPRWDTDSLRPYVGILGVLLGSIIATLASRVTSFGLADLRGGLQAGFDEGAWITTAFGIGQMMAGVASPYLGAIFGVRRILLHGILLMFIASLLGPLSPNLNAFMAMQVLGGIGSGTFIPLTISFIIRSLPARLVVYGIAFYAMNSELSQNVAASLEGWYSDHWSWRWIDWQYCVMLPLMFACISFGVPKEPVNTGLMRELDWPGIAYAAIGLGLLYAGLDQGNRLGWSNNGLVIGLLLSGGLVTLVFLFRELTTPLPFLNLRRLLRGNLLLLLLAGFRFIILSTAYIIPTYLQTVQNFRELQVGSVLLWIALPQLVLAIPLAELLRRTDGRWVLALGSALIGIACWMGTGLTSEWATVDFLPSQILQALGQSFALTALLALIVRTINLADALAIGSLLQISRLFGGEIGTAFMQTFVRVREQIHSNLVGLHVDGTAGLTIDRLATYRAIVASHTADLSEAGARAAKLLATTVAQQASVLSFIDGFMAAAGGAFLCMVLVALMQRPPPSRF